MPKQKLRKMSSAEMMAKEYADYRKFCREFCHNPLTKKAEKAFAKYKRSRNA